MPTQPRYVPARGFPAYAYIPGQSPHPVTDPRGHSYGAPRRVLEPLVPERWHQHEEYLWGFDLYNHGYPWEAHEAWEGLWRMSEQRSVERAFLQGLIQCAAALVKARAGQAAGVVSLGESAVELLHTVLHSVGAPYMGVALDRLVVEFADYAAVWRGPVPVPVPMDDEWPRIVLVGKQAAIES